MTCPAGTASESWVLGMGSTHGGGLAGVDRLALRETSEILAQFFGRLVPIVGTLGQTFTDDRFEVGRHLRVELAKRRGLLPHMLVGHGDGRLALERRPTG